MSTPKAIAKKIKAKGLQKLRFYCQVCEKQMRDANGFKCHLKSEGHLRQMAIFGQDPKKFVEQYSREFEESFLQHFRTAHRHSRILANKIYNEFIGDRNHVHMNSTKWLSLTAFVTYLGRSGKCKVEESDEGFFLTLIQKDPEEEMRDKMREQRKKAEEADEIRHAKALKAQVARAKKLAGGGAPGENDSAACAPQPRDIRREAMSGPLGFGIRQSLAASAPAAAATTKVASLFAEEAGGVPEGGNQAAGRAGGKRSTLDEIMEEQEAAKRRREATTATTTTTKALPKTRPPWILPGIVVKILSKELKSAGFYKEKAAVLSVVTQGGRHLGELEHLKSGAILRVDQDQLETVIPKEGGRVRVLQSGELRGRIGTLVRVDVKKYKAEVEVSGGARAWLEYDDISKSSKV